jgi:hypothetical protein
MSPQRLATLREALLSAIVALAALLAVELAALVILVLGPR